MNLFEKQLHIESTYNKTQAHQFIKELLKDTLEPYGEHFPEPKDWKTAKTICAALLVHQKMYIQNLVEMMVKKNWLDSATAASYIAETIIKMMDIDMVDYMYKGEYLEIHSKWAMTEEIAQEYKRMIYKLPMVIAPNRININRDNRGSGYYLDEHDSLILTHHHSYRICTDVLETLNNTPLSINKTVVKHAVHTNNGCIMKEHESKEEYQQRMEHWKVFIEQTKFVHEMIGDNPFFLTHKYDTRGRCYDMGYHVHTQGDSYSKAVIQLANEEVVSDSVNFF